MTGRAWFWSPAGTSLAVHPFTLGSHATLVINTATTGLAGQAGSITLSHDGGYGVLAYKGVSLEPATGYSFDTPLVWRPR